MSWTVLYGTGTYTPLVSPRNSTTPALGLGSWYLAHVSVSLGFGLGLVCLTSDEDFCLPGQLVTGEDLRGSRR